MTIDKTTISRRACIGAMAFGAFSSKAQTQRPTEFDTSRTLKIIVAYPPGGVGDILGRVVAQQLSKQIGMTVEVDNQGGAGGQIAAAAIAKAPPDGYTIGLMAESPITIAPHLGKLPYKAEDLCAIASLTYSPQVLCATPAFAGRTFQSLIETAKARPGAMRVASSGGYGTPGHMVVESIQRTAGVKFTTILYKGGTQPVTDALNGTFEVLCTTINTQLLQTVQSGKLRVLAVTGQNRIQEFPEAPTLKQLGHPKANLTSVFSLFGPARMPRSLVRALHEQVNKALYAPEVSKAIRESMSQRFVSFSPEIYASQISANSAAFSILIKMSGLTAAGQ